MEIPPKLTRTGPWRVLEAAATWPVTSQQTARRNALVGSTALAARRHERQEVEAFLADHAAARQPDTGSSRIA